MTGNTMAVLQRELSRLKNENESLQHEVRSLREFVTILNDLAHKARAVQNDEELLPTLRDILIKAMNLLNAPDGSLALIDEESDQLVFVLVEGALSEQLTGYRLPSDDGIAGWVFNNQEPALVRDVRRDQRFFTDVDEEFKFNTLSIACAPLIGNGRVLGIVEVLNQPGDEPFSENDMALLNLMCLFAGEALADIERRPSME